MWTPCREWMMLFFSCGPGRWKLCKSSKKTDISCWENTNLWYFRKLSKLISQLNSIEISPAGGKKPVKCQEVSRKQRSVGWDWRVGQLWSDHLIQYTYIYRSLSTSTDDDKQADCDWGSDFEESASTPPPQRNFQFKKVKPDLELRPYKLTQRLLNISIGFYFLDLC